MTPDESSNLLPVEDPDISSLPNVSTTEDSDDSDRDTTIQDGQGLLYMFDSGLSSEMLLVLSILMTAFVSGSTCFCLGYFCAKSKRLEDEIKEDAEHLRLIKEERQARVASLADL